MKNILVNSDARIFDKFSNDNFDMDARAFDKFSNENIDIDARAFDKFSSENSDIDARAFDKFLDDKEKLNTVSKNLQFNNHLEKHEKYLKSYKSNELFWGLGIENEFYLECESRPEISRDFFLNNHVRERYSVNYYSNYDVKLKNEAFAYTNHFDVDIPYLINSHSFTDTDRYNNHKKIKQSRAIKDKSSVVDEKLRDVNPDFVGKTLGEEILESNSYLKNNFNKTWLYDGDTFEITTLNFYKTNITQMINELELYKKDFIESIQKYQEKTNLFLEFGKIKIMEKNYPFAIHMTNLNNIGIFNNGTLHYNLTLPTELDNNMLVKNPVKFKKEHKEAIKIIQLFEPLLICVYGTTDYFSQLIDWENANKFSASSQRCAVSRYIGLGTYDTDEMITGKILLTELSNFPDYFWYNKYHEQSAYNKLEKIGLDINYNKHYNHGIEIRFLDHISKPELIIESFEFIVYLFDLTLESEFNLENPIKTKFWNDLVCNVMTFGKKYIMTFEELEYFEKILNIKIEEKNIVDVYYEIFSKLKTRFSMNFNDKNISIGRFSRHVLMPEKIIISYPPNIQENYLIFNTDDVVDLEKFTCEINYFINISNLPKEILNIVEIVDTFDEIKQHLSSLTEINKNSNSKTLKLLNDINQIIKSSIDVINYNIEKILENKNNIDTCLFIKIMNLIGCFKII
jgi:hypothetical protein